MTDLQIALNERDQIIKELAQSLKQTIDKHDVLVNQVKQLKESAVVTSNTQRKWLLDRNVLGERLSETTIDLVSESEFEDDEANRRLKTSKASPLDDFKSRLSPGESELFACVEQKFNGFLNDKIKESEEKVRQHQLAKSELETELGRVQLLLVNAKNGTAAEPEWRSELKKQHEKEMDDLRLFFERKCTELEKQ